MRAKSIKLIFTSELRVRLMRALFELSVSEVVSLRVSERLQALRVLTTLQVSGFWVRVCFSSHPPIQNVKLTPTFHDSAFVNCPFIFYGQQLQI